VDAINPACNALTTVARLRAAGFGGQASNSALQIAINAISAMVERECDREFRVSCFGGDEHPPELVQGSGSRILVLSTYPILEVSKVEIDGAEVTDWQLIPGLAKWGALDRRSKWPRREGHWGDLVCDPDGEADWNVAVSYKAGFREVPADLELAVMTEVDLVAGGSGGKATRRIQSERTPGGWSIAYGKGEHQCSMSSVRIFESYRRKDL
jgi:hypothetical protein